ncbi:DUF6020 family protein [Bifidobacterium parmae]|uniref:DUF6020 family protein n=1 Tax=Bifidobacterium parmae TaxID=361854 RepID=UPI001055609A|nr:DUF6020 family protein [Bifidobacterium parmae]
MVALVRSSRRTVWLPLLLGLVMGVGGYSATRGAVSFGDPTLYVQCLAYAALFCLLFPLLFSVRERARRRDDRGDDAIAVDSDVTARADEDDRAMPAGKVSRLRKAVRFEYVLRAPGLLRDALRVFVCWAPYVILLYPGILYWDTGDQVAQFFGMSVFGQEPGQIWNHHPFLDTYFYGSVIWLGHAVSGHYEVGMFLLSVVHAFLAAVAVSAVLAYLRGRGLTRRPLIAVTATFCFFPVFPIMFASIVKDTTFTIALLGWFVMYLLLVDSKLASITRPGFLAGFVVMSLLVALTKSVGLYVMVAALLLLVIGRYKAKFKAVCVAVAIACFAFVSIFLPKVVFPRLDIVPGERQAAIVVPIQMVARVAHANPSDVTDEEKQVLNEYLPMSWDEMARNYVPFTTDPVTGYAIKDTGSVVDFAKAWLSVGLKHPRAYVQAFISVESGWLAFNGAPANNVEPQAPYPEIALQYQPLTTNALNDSTFGRFVPNGTPSKGQTAVKGLVRWVQDVPILNVFMYLTVWALIVPAYLLYALIRRRPGRDDVIRFIPYWFVTAFLFLCPVTIQLQNDHSSPTRYAFSMLVMGVAMIGVNLLGANAAVNDRQNHRQIQQNH